MARSGRGSASTGIAIAASILISFYVFGADGHLPGSQTTRMTLLSGATLAVSVGAAVLLLWRHRQPVLVTGLALVPPVVLLGDPTAALIALAALAASRRGPVLWAGAAAVYLATGLALWHDSRRDPAVSATVSMVGARPGVGQTIGLLVFAAVLTAIPL